MIPGAFRDARTIIASHPSGKTETLSAPIVAICTGARPRYLAIPGCELAISSDDLFSRPTLPGKTLVLGGGYVALELAGLLAGLGCPTAVLHRSVYLRGLDTDMCQLVVADLATRVRFFHTCTPVAIERVNARLRMKWIDSAGVTHAEEFDTIVCAVGREAATHTMNLDAAGVQLGPGGRVVADADDATTAPGVYALGDVAVGRPELAPVAIQSGKLLAGRLFAPEGSPARMRRMHYEHVPTVVFTPLEYASVGLSEEAAARLPGARVEIFHSRFTPLEWQLSPGRPKNGAACKVVVDLAQAPEAGGRVLGLHFAGPHAGEVLQGFALAFSKGLTKDDLDHSNVALHPTSAEELLMTSISKSSGKDPNKAGC